MVKPIIHVHVYIFSSKDGKRARRQKLVIKYVWKKHCLIPHMAKTCHMRDTAHCLISQMVETCHVWDKAWPYDSCGRNVSSS